MDCLDRCRYMVIPSELFKHKKPSDNNDKICQKESGNENSLVEQKWSSQHLTTFQEYPPIEQRVPRVNRQEVDTIRLES